MAFILKGIEIDSFNKTFLVSFYLCVCVFSLANMYVYHMYPWYPQRSENSIEFLGTGVMDGFEPPYGY